MNAKRLFCLSCFGAGLFTASFVVAGQHRGQGAGQPATVHASSRTAPATFASSGRFRQWNGASPARFRQGNGAFSGRFRQGNRVSSARFNNWNGNWHHRRFRDRFIFIDAFGFPFYNFYPYPYYGYYPYGYSAYYQGGAAYSDDSAYDDDATYNNGNAYRGGAAANSSTVAQVQRNLARGGYYKGAIDGEMGPRTYYAIRAYQRSNNLRVDGAINDQILSRMGLR
jgi:Putative peptidoglycan binding domain